MFYKNLSMWLVIGLTMILLFNLFNKPQAPITEMSYSDFISSVESGMINQITITGNEITGTIQGGTSFKVIAPPDLELMPMLRKSGVDIVQQRTVEHADAAIGQVTIARQGGRRVGCAADVTHRTIGAQRDRIDRRPVDQQQGRQGPAVPMRIDQRDRVHVTQNIAVVDQERRLGR